MNKPNVIFCNLQNSGSSAIDPILREIFKASGYHTTPYGPEGSHKLLSDLNEGRISSPFYHWSHSSVSCFGDLINSQTCKFIFLHRDPRDAAVSWAHHFKTHQKSLQSKSFSDVLEMVVTHNLIPHLYAAVEWLQTDCLKVKFEDVRHNTKDVILKILDYAQYFRDGVCGVLSSNEIHEIVKKHSFERVAGHARGEWKPGIKLPKINKGYMYRSGTTGEWKNHFSEYLLKRVDALFGEEITQLGYQNSHTRTINVVSPPFACGVAWLINCLMELDLRTSNTSFGVDQWTLNKKKSQWSLSERAHNHLSWHLPALHKKDTFEFSEAINIRWEHRLDLASYGIRKTILFIRDPRDAVYSLYKRYYENKIEFIEYLNQPDVWPEHFPGIFQLPPLETYAYYCWFWLKMADVMPLKVIKFEDAKSNPIEVIKGVLSFIDVKRSAPRIRDAVDGSSFDNALKAMKKMESITGKKFATTRRGQPNEWINSYRGIQQINQSSLIKDMLIELGYDTHGQTEEKKVHGDSEYEIECMTGELKMASLSMLNEVERGNAPTSDELISKIYELNLLGEDLVKFALVCQAIYFCEQIFPKNPSKASKAALKLFVEKNLKYRAEPVIQNLAHDCLRRFDSQIKKRSRAS